MKGRLAKRALTFKLAFILGLLGTVVQEIGATTLVTNFGERIDGSTGLHAFDHAQAFTTGANPEGYTLNSVDLQFPSTGPAYAFSVTIWSTRTDSLPGDQLRTLTAPSTVTTGNNTFTTSGFDLDPSTTYFIVMTTALNSSSNVSMYTTDSDDEDVGAANGWTVSDDRLQRNRLPLSSPWSSQRAVLKMQINGIIKNNSATGAPSITGTPQSGQKLVAATGNVADRNGLTIPSYTYQWIRVANDGTDNERDIPGATSNTYMPWAADVDKKLKVRVSFTDDNGYQEQRTSNAWPTNGAIVARPTVCPADTHWCTTLTVGRRIAGGTTSLG